MNHSKAGITILIWLQKLVLTDFTENCENRKKRSVFGTKINFRNLGKKLKTERFFQFIDWFFWFIEWFSAGFLFKIQILNEKQ
jgi:hypothetical protein